MASPLRACHDGAMMQGLSSDPPILQRACGRAEVGFEAGGGRMRLTALRQEGSAKVFVPRVHGPVPEAVFLNTAGGLTGGDRLAYALQLGAGARAVAGSQTAERAYAASRSGGAARAELEVRLALGPGAALDWLPQETILYEGAALHRHTRADLGRDARLLLAEMVVFGRAAMGERPKRLRLVDRREVWREGRPVWLDPFRLEPEALDGAAPVDSAVPRPRVALLDGARAIATLALVAPGAEDAAEALRAAWPADCRGGVSGWDGRCLVRMTAADGLPLKRGVARLLGVLRQGAPLPRVWQI